MKRLILILMLSGISRVFGETYTEFYINNAGGDNLNSGHTSEATATYSTTGCNWTNDTSATVGTIYKSGLGAAATAVTNGAFASIFPDGTTGATPFVGMVVTNDATKDTIQISLVNKGGTKPASSTAGTSIRVGGAWAGPGTYDGLAAHPETNTFPMALINGAMTNGPLYVPCFNIKSGTTYNITNGMTTANSGAFPIRISGYTTTVRDGGRPKIDGGTTYSGYILWNISGNNVMVTDMEFSNNGNASTGVGISSAASGLLLRRVLVHDIRTAGINVSGNATVDECEVYSCMKNATVQYGGMRGANYGILFRNCISHDNLNGTYGNGFLLAGGVCINSIAYNNSAYGFCVRAGNQPYIFSGCEAYSNSMAGWSYIDSTPQTSELINCNFLKNGGMAITNTGNAELLGIISHCGFGTGTQANVAGDISENVLFGMVTNNLTIYAANATPWTDPANGNFSIALTAAKSSGLGSFLQSTVNSPTNTIAYPDIGAAQASDTNSASSEHSHVFAQ